MSDFIFAALLLTGDEKRKVPSIDYNYLPVLPDEKQTLEAASEAANAAALASSEAFPERYSFDSQGIGNGWKSGGSWGGW